MEAHWLKIVSVAGALLGLAGFLGVQLFRTYGQLRKAKADQRAAEKKQLEAEYARNQAIAYTNEVHRQMDMLTAEKQQVEGERDELKADNQRLTNGANLLKRENAALHETLASIPEAGKKLAAHLEKMMGQSPNGNGTAKRPIGKAAPAKAVAS